MLLRRIAIVTLVASCVGASSQAGHAATDLRVPGVIKVTGREVSRVKEGVRAGDTEVMRLALYNRRITAKAIGRGSLVCVYLGHDRDRNCTGTFVLPRGTIVVGGATVSDKIYNLAVLGGTGLYDNVHGALTATLLGGGPPRYLLLFRLLV